MSKQLLVTVSITQSATVNISVPENASEDGVSLKQYVQNQIVLPNTPIREWYIDDFAVIKENNK